MISDEEIDVAVLANTKSEWRKLAFVVGMAMMQIESSQRAGRDDFYFAQRVASLVERGLLEHKGDLLQMRQCEVRLTEF